jgi:phage-related minor tail protein
MNHGLPGKPIKGSAALIAAIAERIATAINPPIRSQLLPAIVIRSSFFDCSEETSEQLSQKVDLRKQLIDRLADSALG